MTPPAKLQSACEQLVMQLAPLWQPNPKQSYYDDWLGMCHEHPAENRFEIATSLLDYTTYYLDFDAARLRVHVKRLDNYKLHERAKFLDSTMDAQDWQDLHATLQRLLHVFTAYRALESLPLKDAWLTLQTALFSEPRLGEPPQKPPALARNPFRLAKALLTTLKKSKRFAEFDWREWHYEGVKQVRKMAPVKASGVELGYPSAAEIEEISQSDDFHAAVLDWFGGQLCPHGLTLLAIGPVDEMQTFGLAGSENIAALSAALKTLCIYFEMPAMHKQVV